MTSNRTLAHALAALAFAVMSVGARADEPPVEYRSVTQLQDDLAHRRLSSELLVGALLARIEAVDRGANGLQSVIAINPQAIEDARALDEERAVGHVRGPLHGIPVLVKDNVETADPVPTTAGSLALAKNQTDRDAPIVARLRAAGAIILGKTNLSEWANMRGSRSISGWSGVGGLVRNPYALDRNSCGSSSGSGAALAAGFSPLAIGTETDGSVTCPASVNGVVGFKPTLGLLSRTHIVPIAHSQDTAGPMGRSVADVAAMLTVMAGTDPDDPATADADKHKADYAAGLDAGALAGKRIGVARFLAGFHPETDAVFARALDTLKAAGATLVEIPKLDGYDKIGDAEFLVLTTELKADLNKYLATTPPAVTARTLKALIEFNRAHADRELALFGQEDFEKAEAGPGLDDAGYQAALALEKRLAGREGIDKLLAQYKVDALVAPTAGPAWVNDVVNGDHSQGSTPTLPAVAGYPHLSLPMGTVQGLPVGLSIIGPRWGDAQVLALGYAFEQKAGLSLRPAFAASVTLTPPVGELYAPSR